jgi:hypothetical protein
MRQQYLLVQLLQVELRRVDLRQRQLYLQFSLV